MSTTKTQKWLSAITGETKTQKEAEWFLAMWYVEMASELTWKERAKELQADILCPPTYEGLEEQFFDGLEEPEDEEIAKERTMGFYGL